MCDPDIDFDEDDPIYGRFGEDWEIEEAPSDAGLTGVVSTACGPVACGEGGTLIRRDDDGEWHVVIDAGPHADHNPLNDIDVTDCGRRVWFLGGSGAVGAYDVDVDRKYDYTAPGGKTSTWEAIAVTGERDEEVLLAANGSGEVLPAFTDDDGCPVWGAVTEPGAGSTIPALDIGTADGGYAADTTGEVHEKVEPETWERIGIDNAEVDFNDLVAVEEFIYVVGAGGHVYRYDHACSNWTPNRIGQQPITGVDTRAGVVVASAAEGTVVERTPTEGWVQRAVGVDDDLVDMAVGEHVDVAVGEGATIVVRE